MSHLIAPSLPAHDEPLSSSSLLVSNHNHKDLVQAVSFNTYGDRCATGSADGKIRVFNRHRDGIWHLYDVWGAHGGEVLELQWLPTSIYPSLIASLGIDGHFKIWSETPHAPSGRRFSASRSAVRPAHETRSPRAPYRSFSMRHDPDSRHTHLALLTADGELSLHEFETPETLGAGALLDELRVCPKPLRGEEVAFRVVFDPNPLPCYTALRAGVPVDSLAVVVAAMEAVKVYRTKDVQRSAMGATQMGKALYLAADIHVSDHSVLVRDVAWAPGNIRGFDIIAAACQDGSVRVFRLETPLSPLDDGRSWAMKHVMRGTAPVHPPPVQTSNSSGLAATFARASSGLSGAVGGTSSGNKEPNGKEGEVVQIPREVAKLEQHQAPVWRVGFDDDGQILGSVGDSGRLICYRQMPNGGWAKSSELKMERRESNYK